MLGRVNSKSLGCARIIVVMDTQSLRESVTGAIRYWEPRRLAYNGVLALIILIYFGLGYPSSRSTLSVDLVLSVFLLAVVANVAYCSAYPVDIFVCASSYGEQWKKYRRVVFVVGLLFAAVITRFFALGMFESGSVQAR